MADLAVRDLDNKEVRRLELADGVFAYPKKPFLVHEAVLHHLARARAGTHATKTRADVSGGGRKPWRQKKTGRARAGSIRSPLWRGGGTVQGPQPRSYDYSFPKKKRANALRSVISEKVREDRLLIVEDLPAQSHRTKDLLQSLSKLGIPDEKALLVDVEPAHDLVLASRNLGAVSVARVMGLTAYDVLNHDHLVMSVAAVDRLSTWLAA
ncbi:MAG: 50S ribosomal protein L4 [Acidobacteriota bacterium]